MPKGWEEKTWEPLDNLLNVMELITEFHKRHKQIDS
jgi:hypothetical protein